MRAHAQRNAQMQHAHTDALTHTRTHAHMNTPFTLQLVWVLDNLVLTCCSDDGTTAIRRCPLSPPMAPSVTLLSR